MGESKINSVCLSVCGPSHYSNKFVCQVDIKVNFLTRECHESLRSSGGSDPPIFNSALGGVEWSGSQNGSLTL